MQSIKSYLGIAPSPGLYRARWAPKTIIEVFDEVERGFNTSDGFFSNVRISLKEGGNLVEDKSGLGMMGLMPDAPFKKRFHPIKSVYHYFEKI